MRTSLQSAGRERLLSAAEALFMRHGSSNVGINEVTAKAGVARMTLYNNFASKEDLTAAVYLRLADETLRQLRELLKSESVASKRIAAVFDHFAKKTPEDEFRGCPFIQASLQSSQASGEVLTIVREYKSALRGHFLHILDAWHTDREILSDQVLLLLDGAATQAYLGGAKDPFGAAKHAVTVLLASAT